MATIGDLEDLLMRIPGVTDQTAAMIVAELRRRHPGEKIYIPAPDTSKRAEIEKAMRTLPTGIVAERFGVTQSYVCRVIKRRPKN